jgi:hypothetical protein
MAFISVVDVNSRRRGERPMLRPLALVQFADYEAAPADAAASVVAALTPV